MNSLAQILRPHAALERGLDSLRPWLLLFVRLWVSWQFLKSGWLKLTHWDVTLELFRMEYQVPILPPAIAAVTGTLGELCFPILLMIGFLTRVGALGLFAVNALAVISYWHVLGGEGYEAALAQHVLWGFMLVVLIVCGGGAFTLDQKLGRR